MMGIIIEYRIVRIDPYKNNKIVKNTNWVLLESYLTEEEAWEDIEKFGTVNENYSVVKTVKRVEE